jgi:hypothetical protein
MGTQLEAQLFSVGGLFAEMGTHYEIPIYQRNYAWRNQEIDQLIDDVLTAAEDPDVDEYFLGNMIVAPKTVPTGTNHTTYEVVDGQQRLTTLFMLLHRLGIGRSARLTYASRRSATDALSRLSTSDDDEGSGILTGYKAIDSRISRLSKSPSHLRVFTHFLTERVQLVRAVLPDDTDLNRYFEIMNTRGQQLAPVDIVKARLMSYLRSDAQDVDDQRACLAWIWDACSEMDTYIQMSMTRGSTSLRDTIFGATWDDLIVQRFEDLVPLRPNSEANGSLRSGAVGLRQALAIYARAPEPPSEEDDEAGRFETPIKFPSLLLHTLKIMRSDDAAEVDGHLDDSKLIKRFHDEFSNLSELSRSRRVKEFVQTLLRCKFALDNFVLKREFTSANGEDGAWSLKRLVRGSYVSRHASGSRVSARFPSAFAPTQEESDAAPADDSTRNVLLLQSLLRVTYTSPRTMHWITRVLQRIAGDHKLSRAEIGAAIETDLRQYIRSKVRQSLPGGGGPTGFDIERIVYTYLDYLLARGASQDMPPDPSFTFVFRNSVEHFFPQHADSGDHGSDAVPHDAPELNMFGNLALVSVSDNSKFSNALPLAKTWKEREIQQSKKLELMANITRASGHWDLESIRSHDHQMIELLRADLDSAGH